MGRTSVSALKESVSCESMEPDGHPVIDRHPPMSRLTVTSSGSAGAPRWFPRSVFEAGENELADRHSRSRQGARRSSVAVGLVAEPPAQPRVRAHTLELQAERPAGDGGLVEEPAASVYGQGGERADMAGFGRHLRADQQLAAAERALQLRPEPTAGGPGIGRRADERERHQSA